MSNYNEVHEIASAVGQSIRALRLKKGKSQEDFAKAIPLAQPLLSQIENGAPRVSLLNYLRIARALEVSFGKILKDAKVEDKI